MKDKTFISNWTRSGDNAYECRAAGRAQSEYVERKPLELADELMRKGFERASRLSPISSSALFFSIEHKVDNDSILKAKFVSTKCHFELSHAPQSSSHNIHYK